MGTRSGRDGRRPHVAGEQPPGRLPFSFLWLCAPLPMVSRAPTSSARHVGMPQVGMMGLRQPLLKAHQFDLYASWLPILRVLDGKKAAH